MARTQAVDYAEKRAAIVEAAAALFAERGFNGASLADLAGRCAMSKSLIYHYYASKEAILYDVMRGHMDDLLAALTARDLKSFARDLLRRYAGAAARQKVLLYEIGHLPAAHKTDIVARERQLIARVEALLAAAGASGDRRRLRARAMLFFGMLNWTHTWFRPSGAMSRDELAELAAETILARSS
jgi:AcrR family transcriptional regulator